MSVDVTSVALQGLDRAQQKVEKVARRLAKAADPETASSAGDTVDLATNAVDLIEAVNLYQANLKMVRAEDELTKRTLDLLA